MRAVMLGNVALPAAFDGWMSTSKSSKEHKEEAPRARI